MDDARDASPAHIPRRRRRRLVVARQHPDPPRSPTRTRPTTRESSPRSWTTCSTIATTFQMARTPSRAPRAPAQPIDERAEDDARATPLDPLLQCRGRVASPNASSPAPTARARALRRGRAPRARPARASPSHGPRCHPTRRRVRPRAARPWDGSSAMTHDPRGFRRHRSFETLLAAARRPGGVDAAARVPRSRVRIPPDGRARSKPHPRRLLRVRHRSTAVMRDGPAVPARSRTVPRYYPCYMWGVRDHFDRAAPSSKSHPPSTARVPSSVTPLHFAARFSRTIARRAVNAWSSSMAVAGAPRTPPRVGVVRVGTRASFADSSRRSVRTADRRSRPTSSRSPRWKNSRRARWNRWWVSRRAKARKRRAAHARGRTPRGARSCRAIRFHARSRASVSTPPRRVARVFSTSPRRTCVDDTTPQRRTRRALRRGNTGSVAAALVRGTGSRRLRVPAARGRRRVGRGSTRNRASREGGGGARGEGGGGAASDGEKDARRGGKRDGRSRFRRVRRTVRRRTHGRERMRAARGGEGVGEEATLRGGRRRRRRRERIGPETDASGRDRSSCARTRRSTTRSRIGYEELRSRGVPRGTRRVVVGTGTPSKVRGRVRGRVGAEKGKTTSE